MVSKVMGWATYKSDDLSTFTGLMIWAIFTADLLSPVYAGTVEMMILQQRFNPGVYGN
jgi:hypothetical protein